MFVFFDTEFTDLHRDARLISIGLISEDGRMFYAELIDTYSEQQCSDFVREEVLPQLEGGNVRVDQRTLSLNLGEWIESFDQPVTLASDSPDWDWPFVLALFHSEILWPNNLDRQPKKLLAGEDPNEFADTIDSAYATGLRRHHALDDAKAKWLVWVADTGLCKTKW